MEFLLNCLRGLVSVLTISSSPLYRYPYRNAAEAFRGDWQKIGQDLSMALDKIDER